MNFEKRFNTYDENAFVQKIVAQNLVKFLKQQGIKECGKVFEIGCGTGIFSREFLKEFGTDSYILNDKFDVREYIKELKFEGFLLGDIESLELPKCDIVVSSSVFQWVKELEKLIQRIAKSSKQLAFSIYVEGNLQEIREHFGIGLNYMEVDEILKILKRFYPTVRYSQEIIKREFETPLQALKHLKYTGVTGFDRSDIGRLRAYKDKTLTYEVLYIFCEKIASDN